MRSTNQSLGAFDFESVSFFLCCLLLLGGALKAFQWPGIFSLLIVAHLFSFFGWILFSEIGGFHVSIFSVEFSVETSSIYGRGGGSCYPASLLHRLGNIEDVGSELTADTRHNNRVPV